MGGETSSNSPKPSSSSAMEVGTLVITMISAMDLKAHDVYLVVSLSGDKSKPKQSTPVHKHGSTDPWLGHTFQFTVDKAAALGGCLKFKIKKAKRTVCLKKDVGEVDVPVRDLLVNGGTGDVKPKVLSYEVRSSSGETQGVLQFYCELVPPPAKKADEPATGYPAATAPPASNSAATYSPPMPRAAPPPSGYAMGAYPSAAYPSAGYLQAADPSVRYAPADIPQATWGYRPNAAPNYGYLPPAGYPAAAALPATYPPPMPGAAPYPQTVYTPNTAPNYQSQGYMHPPAGYGYAAPPLHAGGNSIQTAYLPNTAPTYGHLPQANVHPPAGHGLAAPMLHAGGNSIQTAYLPNTALTYGYLPPANVHPPAGHGLAARMLHAGGNFLESVMSRVTADVILNGLNDPGNNDGP